MDWGSIVWILLAIVGAAAIVGGIVAYRGSKSTGGQAAGAALAAAGIAMWAIVLITVPVSSSGGDSPDPIVSGETIGD
jgi:drug/metabolite transporter (DMT)-like permease